MFANLPTPIDPRSTTATTFVADNAEITLVMKGIVGEVLAVGDGPLRLIGVGWNVDQIDT